MEGRDDADERIASRSYGVHCLVGLRGAGVFSSHAASQHRTGAAVAHICFCVSRSIIPRWSIDGAPIGPAAGIRDDERNQQQSKLLVHGDCRRIPDDSVGPGHRWYRADADGFDEIRTDDAEQCSLVL